MNKKMTFLAALLAAGLLMAGCSVTTPLAIGPTMESRIDAELEDEWDEDAPNWHQPDLIWCFAERRSDWYALR